MDLDTVADTLYGLPREEFTAARDERAREARSTGDRELGNEIRRLRKPSTAAWLANQLARDQPAEVDKLVELGESMRRAHAELDGEALRRLSAQRHELVGALVARTREVGRSAGHPVSDAVARELESTFTAALTDPDAARTLATGRLTSGLDAGSSDWAWAPVGGRPAVDAAPAEQQRRDPKRRQAEQRDRIRRDLDAAREDASAAASQLRDAEDRRAEADRALAQRRAELEAAQRRAQQAEQRVQQLVRRLDQP